MDNTVEKRLFWISQGKVATVVRWAHAQAIDVKFSRFMAQTTRFRARKCLLCVTTIDDVIWGKYAPNPLKVGVNRQFQAKMPKYENCSTCISKTVNPIRPR